MGPEPITRMRCMSARRGMDQIIDDVTARATRGPSCRTPELLAVAHQYRHVHRTCPCRIGCNVGRDAELLQDSRGECAHRAPLTTADVVDLSLGAALQQ